VIEKTQETVTEGTRTKVEVVVEQKTPDVNDVMPDKMKKI
jgi:hypothetical protein